MIDIFKYTDFRNYLKDYFEEERKKKPRVITYEYLAGKFGFKSRGFFYNVLKKNSKISKNSCVCISKGIKHSSDEAKYFETITFIPKQTKIKAGWIN